MILRPAHPEHPITLTDLPPGTTVTFSLKGVTVTIPIPGDPEDRVSIYRMDRHGSDDVPWTITHKAPPPEEKRVYAW